MLRSLPTTAGQTLRELRNLLLNPVESLVQPMNHEMNSDDVGCMNFLDVAVPANHLFFEVVCYDFVVPSYAIDLLPD